MRVVVLLPFLASSSLVPANDPYKNLVSALDRGVAMRAIFYYGSCKLDGGDSVNATGSLDVNEWTRTDDAVVLD